MFDDTALDLSTEEFNHFLSIASLFEGTFSIDWIQELTRRKATQVLFAFEKAVRDGLIKRNHVGSFAFSDKRKRQNWQDRLTFAEKERLHRLIANMFINELPEAEDKAEYIAPHLIHLSNDLDGCKWLMKAASTYQAAFRTEEAIGCYSKLLDDLSGEFSDDTDYLFCDAAIKYSKLSTAKHDTQKVLSILNEALNRAKNQKNFRIQSILKMHVAKNKWLQSQYKSALNHFEEAWAMARELGDERLLRSATTFNTFFLYWQGRFKDAVRDYEESVADVEKYPHGRFPLLATMTVGTCYAEIGQVTQGLGMIDSIRRLCVERGDTALAAHSGTCIGAVMLDIGRPEEALKHLEPSVEEARKVHRDWTMIQGELMLAYAYYLKAENKKCLEYLKKFQNHSNRVHVSVRSWPYLLELCWAIEEGGLPSLPQISIKDEIRKMIRGQNLCLKGTAYRFHALLQKKEGAPTKDVIASLKQSVELLETSGHQIQLAKSRLELARLNLMQGNRKKAVKSAQADLKILHSLNEALIPSDLKPLLKSTTISDGLLKEVQKMHLELASLRKGKDRIQYIISTLNRITGAERGAIFLIENGGTAQTSRLQLRASKNLSSDQIRHSSFHSSMKMIQEVVATGKGLVHGLQVNKDVYSNYEELIRSRICVPILAGNRVKGVLYHDNRLLSNAFDESQLNTLSSFAALTALILENTEAETEIKNLHEKLNEMRAYYEGQKGGEQTFHFEDIVGESPQIREVMSKVSQVAQSDSTVLILGETGAGKEVVARAIHANSSRKNKPFIPVNCTAFSETLIYSELFGHEKGAFTGADRRRIGRFENASEGTLFLDEIGDLPLDLQVRLLRVLERKEFERVGGTETIRSNFRLVAATNRDLEKRVKEKKFRADLYYRMNVFPIHIPPLRERRQDIQLLVEHFLREQSAKTGKMLEAVPAESMAMLSQYDWPGNVRELKNVVERYALSDNGAHFDISELLDTRSRGSSPGRGAVTLQENERRHILWALDRTRWKIHGPGGAAELLEIHPNTLSFRIKKLGIKRPKGGSRKKKV